MGELHLDIIRDRLVNHYKVKANMGKISISYRSTIEIESTETLTASVEVNGLCSEKSCFVSVNKGKKQSATITMRIQPAERGSGNSFSSELPKSHALLRLGKETVFCIIDAIFVENSTEFMNAIQDGIQAAYDRGAFSFAATGLT